MRPLAWLVSAAVAHASVIPAVAESVYCSTWQQITTCAGPGGYVSHETTWNGITTGDDNRDGKWTRSEWQGREIIAVTPRQER
jgi:hypothetical protein